MIITFDFTPIKPGDIWLKVIGPNLHFKIKDYQRDVNGVQKRMVVYVTIGYYEDWYFEHEFRRIARKLVAGKENVFKNL